MTIVAVPAVTPLPEFPKYNDPSYNTKGWNWGTAIPQHSLDLVGVANATKTNAEHAQTQAEASLWFASQAQARVTDVEAAAQGAFAAANFKGEWSALTGALNVPATVMHQGRLWYLKSNLSNVASVTPALGSAYWGDVYQSNLIPLIAPPGVTVAVDCGYYRLTGPNSVLQLPANPKHRFTTGAYNASGTLTPYIERNGKTICGDAENYRMDMVNARILLMFDENSNDWIDITGGVATYAAPTQGALKQRVVQVPIPAYSASEPRNAAVAHGLSRTQVRGMSVIAQGASFTVNPDYATNNTLNFSAYLEDSNAAIYIQAGNGAGIAGRTAYFTIFYEG